MAVSCHLNNAQEGDKDDAYDQRENGLVIGACTRVRYELVCRDIDHESCRGSNDEPHDLRRDVHKQIPCEEIPNQYGAGSGR